MAVMPSRRTYCFYCAPTSEIRAKYEYGWRCKRCADEMEDSDRYTAETVVWALGSVLRWRECDAHPPERSDIETALLWVRNTLRITPLEREAILVHLVEGSSQKGIAQHFKVSGAAVSKAVKSATKKIAVWLNSPRKTSLK